jgi:murein DD-endopeptidase MepM/ murein hydrolase activator NlpD
LYLGFSSLRVCCLIVTPLLILALVMTETGCVRRGDDWPGGGNISKYSSSTPAAKRLIHVVTKDDTLSGISQRYGVSVQEIAQENRLDDPFVIKEGSRLVLPVQAVSPAAQTTEAAVKRDIDQGTSESVLSLPLSTKITQKFGEGDEAHRNGISFEGYEGAEVRAAESGIVGHVGEIPGLGEVVLVEHKDHLVSVYAHLNNATVSSGEKVDRSQVIGTLGGVGNGAKPTLYFEVRSRAKAVNPLTLLNKKNQ